ncbi:hypothetical protein TNCV_4116591 [Trichonephila clavipes]|nr:hypothetical protein TNCV_4116591 [Trichonephila clavipes]
MPPHIQTVLSASLRAFDKLAIIADKVPEVAGVLDYQCGHNCSPPPSQHLHAVLSFHHGLLSPGRSKSCLYKLLN